MGSFTEDSIITIFEKLTDEGIIIYGPHEVVKKDYNGFPIEFRICPSLTRKPHTVGAALDPTYQKARKWGPGSDMYVPDERLVLARLGNTHDLALNLFCVDKPQLILLTVDSYRRQHEPLDREDFAAALTTMDSLPNMYIIYNCSEKAGCSRVHKHMQGLRGPPEAFEAYVEGSNGQTTVPILYFSWHFVDGFGKTAAGDLEHNYRKLLDQAKSATDCLEGEICPHNVVLWKDWMIVIPRRNAFVEKASANAAGMLGSVWVPDQSLVDEWIRIGPLNVFKGLGIPR
ncbi:hypothetical protein BU24DRAFT_492710 [Aaosphaeria arxii CBS 175.79]|uniref:Uncharacterized protein n=1 Tax=Aaosphaeria arxii CBS 175.79 TaxID=1450172 RepID=A0A6A5XVB7_9PLEO|nr:uncharacterized protein BU24DRAFT_492710 [Aaosphaeria arxii CBS 175.79]KAF2016661.1 hypothetical protein BU24DRAFT_492710 [Aaosphaeria arxii CBS 175.79]